MLALVAASCLNYAYRAVITTTLANRNGVSGCGERGGAIPMSTSNPNPLRKEIPKKKSPVLHCRICDKPVAVETAKTDGAGHAIHEVCYGLKVKLEQASQSEHMREAAARSWKVVAEEVSLEQDPQKLTELIVELNQALEEQGLDGKPKPKGDASQGELADFLP
jgi:hypothetical protein